MQKERSRDCSRYIYGSIRPSGILQHAGHMSASEDLGEDSTLLTQVVSLVQLCCGICAIPSCTITLRLIAFELCGF